MVQTAHRCFPRTLQGARRAREWVKFICVRWREDPDRCDYFVLVTSELVSNALVHGQGSIDVILRRSGESIHIEVSDSRGAGRIKMKEPTFATPVAASSQSSMG
jgi:anti-sigma regulatory factor (Ser/Thr protein kinase)